MDADAKTALEESISAWEEKLKADNPHSFSLGTGSCALCTLFSTKRGGQYGIASCSGCPVSQKAGTDCCRNTPYTEAFKAYIAWKENCAVGQREQQYKLAFREKANAELSFLKSLLEE